MFGWIINGIKRRWRNAKLYLTYQDRLIWVEEVMGQVQEIVDHPEVRQNLSEAVERAEYLKARKVVVMPRIDAADELVLDYFTDSMDEHHPPLLVFPTLRSDACISLIAAYLREHAQPGSYSPPDHMAVLGMDEKETTRFMATTLLHEAGHAIAAEKEGRILNFFTPRDERARLEEELRMWRFDCRLVGFLGGLELRYSIEDTARKICQAWSEGTIFNMKVEASSPLDLCYGPVGIDGAGRRTVLYFQYCELLALHMFFGPMVSYERQLAFISHICQASRKKEADFTKRLQK